MASEALFYAASYLIGLLLCFPFGAASLEMLRLSMAGRRRSALFVALGAGLACGGWATLSFLGVRSILRIVDIPWVKVLLPAVAAALLGWLALLAWRDSQDGDAIPRRAEEKTDPLGPAAQVGKGVLLGLLNPQAIAAWVLALSLLRHAGFNVPRAGSAWLPFFLAVTAGYGTFFVTVIRLAQRLAFLRTSDSRSKLQRLVAVLLAALAGLCALAALRLAIL